MYACITISNRTLHMLMFIYNIYMYMYHIVLKMKEIPNFIVTVTPNHGNN